MRKRHCRIEMTMAAVRQEDVRAIEAEIRRLRQRYSRGGSSFGVSSVSPGTVIR